MCLLTEVSLLAFRKSEKNHLKELCMSVNLHQYSTRLTPAQAAALRAAKRTLNPWPRSTDKK